MREYYKLPVYCFPKKIYDSKLLNRVNKFKSKYQFETHTGRGIFTIKEFFADINVNDIYAYSEDSVLYEFFTGTPLGEITTERRTVKDNFIERVEVGVSSRFVLHRAILYTEKELADVVKPLLRHSDSIGKMIMEYFELHRLVEISNRELAIKEKNVSLRKVSAIFHQ